MHSFIQLNLIIYIVGSIVMDNKLNCVQMLFNSITEKYFSAPGSVTKIFSAIFRLINKKILITLSVRVLAYLFSFNYICSYNKRKVLYLVKHFFTYINTVMFIYLI